ncbi:TetR/AcrR family transcriptional regulator [Amycolatopsis anabasis]|uniref:TetR/AcrR family transcriptional regulator n=1 Tax=Amycolatopsis anabasis TaxID=1840409 RepID=UPI001FE92AEF|nr:TetR/AcrR family transcriptional regulator [Amycolatopsis anabasis]
MSTAGVDTARSRGRIDKRQAILVAAFTVFAREGYAQACVQAIAAEAGVAKPTVYNHLNDKATLFRHAVTAAADRVHAAGVAVVTRLADTGHLRDTAIHLLRMHAAPESIALRRLLHTELSRHPELLAALDCANQVQHALADRFARLSLAGHLSTENPDLAAEQFLALLTGPWDARSRLGTRPIPDQELQAIADAATHTFLATYGTGHPLE